jgi:hypothetical protein
MKTKLAVAIILLGTMAQAKEPKPYQSGTLSEMDSVKCGTDENSAKSITGELIGTDSGHKKTQEVLCQEYVLQGDHLVYHIRPKDVKHPALLPVGEKVQYRIEKDKMILRVEDMDNKDREYHVISTTLKTAVETAATKN